MNSGRKKSALAIICLTRNGRSLGVKLAASMPECCLFLPERLRDDNSPRENKVFFSDFATCFNQVFKEYDGIICIMAAGIVVRSLGALMESKYMDPAVVVVDEQGRFAISLLSGHEGGANALAQVIAQHLGGRAVITTATDVNGKPAVDLLAQQIDALIKPRGNVKLINRSLAEGETVYLYSPWSLVPEWAHGLAVQPWPGQDSAPPLRESLKSPAVIVDCRYHAELSAEELVYLLPRNLHVGIGCRKGVDQDQIALAVKTVFKKYYLVESCISGLASLDIKAQEPALLRLAEDMGLPVKFFDRDTLAALEGSFEGSEWVKQNVGVDGVCEPAARMAAQSGITIVPKQKIGPVTVSVAMEKSWWWDWGQAVRNS